MYIFNLFVYWLSLFFYVPIKDLEVLWILIPIWINFIFTEVFQEREGASLGNAISNGAVMFWVGIDWFRFLMRNYEGFSSLLAFKIFLCVFVIFYGILIIYDGVKGKQITKMIGRIRVVSYIMLVLSPLIYGLIELNFSYVLSIFVFFLLFYYLFELIDLRVLGTSSFEGKYNK